MGIILGRNGKPAREDDDIKLKPGQWIVHLDVNLKTDEVRVTPDAGMVPPKDYDQQKVWDENNFAALCNGLAQITGHLIKSGVSREYIIQKITSAIVTGAMPAEEAWKEDGGVWKLYLIYMPATRQMSIKRSRMQDEAISGTAMQKDAVNKDFYLLCRATHVYIQHIISSDVPVEKLAQAVVAVIDKYLAVGHGDKKVEVGMSEQAMEQKSLKKLLKEATGFMQRILPRHYSCTRLADGIYCTSLRGINEITDKDKWERIVRDIEVTFGKRFLKIEHKTPENHLRFTVCFI